ncbi:MAG: methyltransferase domain-containing protein [Candidatus Diapherotrites archaeon]
MEAFKKETVITFESQAKEYESYLHEILEKFAQDDVERFVSSLQGPRILDVGCGPGVFLEAFRNQGLDGMGIDLSDVFIQRCHEKGLNAKRMDIEHPILYPHSFHGIWGNTALHHMPKEKAFAVIQHFSRLLMGNGILFLTLPDGQGEGYEDTPREGFKQWVAYYTLEDVRLMMGKHFDELHYSSKTLPDGKNYHAFLFRVKPFHSPAYRNF